jgi:hypothetical protein
MKKRGSFVNKLKPAKREYVEKKSMKPLTQKKADKI